MALLLQHTVVYHAGRTGGHWVKAALQAAGLIQGQSRRIHDNPEDLQFWPEAQCRPWSICFVRHPISWVRSFWIHETQFGWTHEEFRPLREYSPFAEYLEQLIDRFPGGAVSRYFDPFVNNVRLIGKFEALDKQLFELLTHAGENIPEALRLPRPINYSYPDIVNSSATAPQSVRERFLANEINFCRRFDYAGIPKQCLADPCKAPMKFFPVLTIRSQSRVSEETVTPENTFLFSDGSEWRGNPEGRRSQLAFWDALSRRGRNGDGTFLELECGDGFFVFLAEELGYGCCRGVTLYPRMSTTAAAARLRSKAQFVHKPALAELDENPANTILIREVLNHTPFPHTLLLHARRMLAPGGEIVIGSVIIDCDRDPGMCISNSARAPLFPLTCPMIMSRAFLLDVIGQCGLELVEVCSEYDEIMAEDKQGLLGTLAEAIPRAADGLIRRVVWRLCAKEAAESEELQYWLRGQPNHLLDFAPVDGNDAASRTITFLYQENRRLNNSLQRLEAALGDREFDLERERHDAALRNAELVDRTARLEQALAELDLLRTELHKLKFE